MSSRNLPPGGSFLPTWRDTSTAAQRYSYVFEGNAQTIDQFLFTQTLLPYFVSLEHGRVDADFPEVYRNDPTRPERLSDHDPVIGYFRFPKADLGLSVTSAPAPVTGQTVVYTFRVTNTLTDPAASVVLSVAAIAGPFARAKEVDESFQRQAALLSRASKAPPAGPERDALLNRLAADAAAR